MQFGDNYVTNRQGNCTSKASVILLITQMQLLPNETRIHVITYLSTAFLKIKECVITKRARAIIELLHTYL